MDPLIAITIALAVFASFVLATAYILKSAIMYRSASSKPVLAGKADTGHMVDAEDEEPDNEKIRKEE